MISRGTLTVHLKAVYLSVREYTFELRPPRSSDLAPSAFVTSTGQTARAALSTVRVPAGWAVYVKRRSPDLGCPLTRRWPNHTSGILAGCACHDIGEDNDDAATDADTA